MSEQATVMPASAPRLVCLGLSHRTAPISLREQVSPGRDRVEEYLDSLSGENGVEEVAILSTCNRLEFYLSATDPEGACEALLDWLAAATGPDRLPALHKGSYIHLDSDAAGHLFRVAAGVESLIVGEAQILGQVRKAAETARALGTMGEHLGPLFQRAISFGRRVRTETAIGRGNVSVASAACRSAAKRLGPLAGKELLIVGSGETAQLAGRHFVKEGVGRVRVLNRTMANARALAGELGGEAVPMDNLQSAIDSADVAVCAVGAPHFILTAEGLARTMRRRPGRPLFLIDLSMPRNIEPEAAHLHGVTLCTIEHLEEIADGNRASRESEVLHIEKLVKKETRKYLRWAASSGQNQLVTTLRRRIATIESQALDRHLRKADPEVREQVARFTGSVLRAVFHDATEYIRQLDPETESGRRHMETIRRLFALDGPAEGEKNSATSIPERRRMVS